MHVTQNQIRPELQALVGQYVYVSLEPDDKDLAAPIGIEGTLQSVTKGELQLVCGIKYFQQSDEAGEVNSTSRGPKIEVIGNEPVKIPVRDAKEIRSHHRGFY